MRPDQRRASRPPIPSCAQMSRRTGTDFLSWSASTSAISAIVSWVDDGGHATGGSPAAWPDPLRFFRAVFPDYATPPGGITVTTIPLRTARSRTQESSTGPTCRIGMHSEKLRRPAVGIEVVTDDCGDGLLWIALTRLTCRHRTAALGAIGMSVSSGTIAQFAPKLPFVASPEPLRLM